MKKLLFLVAAIAAMSFAATKTSVPIHTYDGTTYWSLGYGYAAATVYYDGIFHQFFCSEGLGSDYMFTHPDPAVYYRDPDTKKDPYEKGYWDFIRYRTSKNGETYTGAHVALTPSRGTKLGSQAGSENCACDPAVIKYGDYWYLYYTGNIKNLGTVVFVARSKTITGPFKRYTKRKTWEIWPSDPMPVLQVKLSKAKGEVVRGAYGLGQQSVVVKGDSIHFWFSYIKDGQDQEYKHMVTTRPYPDTTNRNEWSQWTTISIDNVTHYPQSFNSKGENDATLAKTSEANDFGEVRWNPQKKKYQLWKASAFFDGANPKHDLTKIYIKKYESADGLKWATADSIGPYSRIHNIGVSADEKGWIKDGKLIITFSGPHDGLTVNTSARPWDMYQIMVGDNKQSTLAINNGFTVPISSSSLEAVNGDYDGDGITDLGFVDRKNSKWYIYSSQSGKQGVKGISWGYQEKNMTSKYAILVADYDGDGKTDLAYVDKANAKWYIRSSRTGEPMLNSQGAKIWGWKYDGMTSSSIPLTGDYDGDGKADIGFVNPSTGIWYIKASSTARDIFTSGVNKSLKNGKWEGMTSAFIPIEGDYDGDGKTDLAIYAKASGLGAIISSQSGVELKRTSCVGSACSSSSFFGNLWANPGLIPVIGDYDGDGKSERAFVNESNNSWWRLDWFNNPAVPYDKFAKVTGDRQWFTGDYDGDGKSDEAFFNKTTRKFYVHSSRKGTLGVKDVKVTHLYSFDATAVLAKASAKDYDFDVSPKYVVPNLKVESNGSSIYVSNLLPGQRVSIYNMKGQKIFDQNALGSEMSLDIPTTGTYVLKSNSQMVNFSVK